MSDPQIPAGFRVWTPGDRAELDRPHLAESALYGLPGQFVTLLEPFTEADRAALLVTNLAFLASLVGSGPHTITGSVRHPFRIFPLIVGLTSAGRKGTSAADNRLVLDLVDAAFFRDRCQSGFGSGEALVDAVADREDEPSDHRLLVLEAEFARLLRTAQRDGSTLSPLVRNAWDSGKLEVRSRTATAVAHDAHVVVLGHITPGDLRKHLTETECANGFANRFLLVFAHRNKLLPDPGQPDHDHLADLARRIRTAVVEARSIGRVTRTDAAARLWRDLYHRLAGEESDDLVGELTARAPAQVLRIALGHALLAGSEVIDAEHLIAATALWDYSRATVAHLFGDRLGDTDADKLLGAIRAAGPAGLTADEQHRALGRHARAARLRQIRDDLARRSLIHTRTEETGGRPREVTVALARCEQSESAGESTPFAPQSRFARTPQNGTNP